MRVAAQGKIDLANNRAAAQEQGSSTRHQFWSILYMTPCTSKLPNNRAAGSSTRQNITRKYTHNSHSSSHGLMVHKLNSSTPHNNDLMVHTQIKDN